MLQTSVSIATPIQPDAGIQAQPQLSPGLQALFNSLAHGIWIVDAQRHVHYANPIAQQTSQAARCIRLHNGLLEQGLRSERMLLTSTKYYDFSTPNIWRAIRPQL